MQTSRYFAATDAIIDMLRTAGLTVYDGPVLTGDFSAAVYVGYDGDPDGDLLAATMNQDWEGIGARARREDLAIQCAVTAGSGDRDAKIARDAAQEVLSVVETTLREDPSLGLTPSPLFAGVQPTAAYTEAYNEGTVVRIVFQIAIRTRV